MPSVTLIPTFVRTILAFALALLPLSKAIGQDYDYLDSIALSIPDSVTQSVPMLGEFIYQSSTADTARLRIAFVWVARHIQYDLELAKSTNKASQISIENTLKARKTICQGYSDLFHLLLKELKIESFIVSGITKEIDGTVAENSGHAWVAARVSQGSWQLYDPTWASGYIIHDQFVPSFTEKFFQTPAHVLIKTHLPIDPIWQLLSRPFTYEEFVSGAKKEDHNLEAFSFTDSIDTYLKASKLEAATNTKQRAVQFGLSGLGQASWRELDYLDEIIASELYNGAIERYNIIVQNLNSTFQKRQTSAFYKIPKKELTLLIQTSKTEIQAIDQLLALVTHDDLQSYIKKFRLQIVELNEHINLQENYLQGYLKRPRLYKFFRL